jgi:hypothetical protein
MASSGPSFPAALDGGPAGFLSLCFQPQKEGFKAKKGS